MFLIFIQFCETCIKQTVRLCFVSEEGDITRKEGEDSVNTYLYHDWLRWWGSYLFNVLERVRVRVDISLINNMPIFTMCCFIST